MSTVCTYICTVCAWACLVHTLTVVWDRTGLSTYVHVAWATCTSSRENFMCAAFLRLNFPVSSFLSLPLATLYRAFCICLTCFAKANPFPSPGTVGIWCWVVVAIGVSCAFFGQESRCWVQVQGNGNEQLNCYFRCGWYRTGQLRVLWWSGDAVVVKRNRQNILLPAFRSLLV